MYIGLLVFVDHDFLGRDLDHLAVLSNDDRLAGLLMAQLGVSNGFPPGFLNDAALKRKMQRVVLRFRLELVRYNPALK